MMLDSTKNSVESLKECDIFLKTTSNRGQDDVQAKNVAEKSALLIKGGSDLVWYSIDRDIFKTESIFLQKKTNQSGRISDRFASISTD